MKTFSIVSFIVLTFLFFSTEVKAQPNFDDNTIDAPIDGGASLLLGAGVLYGVKKIREKRKFNTDLED